ncbi:MAG TPA: Nmad5 family putative nucleotide modification protein [Trueperaceae bacterium]|nr:Nmad5 family putative nucleotide modification protein [Trueperaceae bacterium]
MASVKLTTALREIIRKRMLRHRFKETYDQLIQDRAALAKEVYTDCFKDIMKQMAAVPAGWLPKDDVIKVQLAGKVHELPFHGQLYSNVTAFLRDSIPQTELTLPYDKYKRVVKVYDARHPIAERHDELENRLTDLKRGINEATAGIDAALNAVTTVGKLLEVWPEAAPFCGDLTQPAVQLPAIQTTVLNRMLGLPVQEAA